MPSVTPTLTITPSWTITPSRTPSVTPFVSCTPPSLPWSRRRLCHAINHTATDSNAQCDAKPQRGRRAPRAPPPSDLRARRRDSQPDAKPDTYAISHSKQQEYVVPDADRLDIVVAERDTIVDHGNFLSTLTPSSTAYVGYAKRLGFTHFSPGAAADSADPSRSTVSVSQ